MLLKNITSESHENSFFFCFFLVNHDPSFDPSCVCTSYSSGWRSQKPLREDGSKIILVKQLEAVFKNNIYNNGLRWKSFGDPCLLELVFSFATPNIFPFYILHRVSFHFCQMNTAESDLVRGNKTESVPQLYLNLNLISICYLMHRYTALHFPF